MNITLDGYLSGPDCELDWHFKSWTQEMAEALCSQLATADTILLGRITYQAMARYWPAKIMDPCLRGDDFAFANMMNQYDKIVFTRTLIKPEWMHSKLAKGGMAKEVIRLKQQPGKNLIVYGSGKLVSAMMRAGLVDEYQLWIHPVILGKGKALFNKNHLRLHTRLVQTEVFTSGVVLMKHAVV